MKIIVLENVGVWYYKVVASNGKCLVHSEIYDSRYNADRAAKSFRRTFLTNRPQVVVQEGVKAWQRKQKKSL